MKAWPDLDLPFCILTTLGFDMVGEACSLKYIIDTTDNKKRSNEHNVNDGSV